MDFIDVLAVLGYFLRLIGALVFGVAPPDGSCCRPLSRSNCSGPWPSRES